MEIVFAALPSILSAGTLAICAWIATNVLGRFQALQDASRADLKADIVRLYEAAIARGYLTHFELDILTRKFEAYKKLGGNSYIAELVSRLMELPVMGEPLPIVAH